MSEHIVRLIWRVKEENKWYKKAFLYLEINEGWWTIVITSIIINIFKENQLCPGQSVCVAVFSLYGIFPNVWWSVLYGVKCDVMMWSVMS